VQASHIALYAAGADVGASAFRTAAVFAAFGELQSCLLPAGAVDAMPPGEATTLAVRPLCFVFCPISRCLACTARVRINKICCI
jgi:hypothetical protein